MLTERQERTLIRLIRLVGKRRYQSLKITAGIKPGQPVTKLTKYEASRLIGVLMNEVATK